MASLGFITCLGNFITGAVNALRLRRSTLWIVLFCNFIIGLPTAIVLCFSYNLGIIGLLIGQITTCFLVSLYKVILLWCTDLQSKTKEAMFRLRLDQSMLTLDPEEFERLLQEEDML